MRTDYRLLFRIMGLLTLLEGAALVPCAVTALVFGEKTQLVRLSVICAIFIAAGIISYRAVSVKSRPLKPRDGYLIAACIWIYCSLLGSIPFLFSGMKYGLIDSIFESTAAFSTTGCSTFAIQLMPKCLLLWRSIANWLGGMGILVLLVSVFPAFGISGQTLAVSETTGPTLEKVSGKFAETGRVLYLTYCTFTVCEFICFLIGGLTPFDAVLNALSSISTGGLVITPFNAELFSGVFIRGVVIVFTLMSCLNYTLYFQVIRGDKFAVFRNYETRVFLAIIACSSVLITLSLRLSGTYSSLWQAFKDSFSQVVSFISTSGYAVCDYSSWPVFATIVLFSLLFIGGCSMSTSGSLKVVRVVTLVTLIRRSVFKQVHPNSVKAVVIDKKAVPASRVSSITTHILLFFIILIFSFIVLSFNNLDFETTVTTALGIFSNTGMALGQIGSSGYFGSFNAFSKIYLCALMIAGRLEIYSILLLFTKSFRKIDSAKNF